MKAKYFILAIVFFLLLTGFFGYSAWRVDGNFISPISSKGIALTPQSLSVTTEANISLTGSLLLVTGDDDGDNDAIDLQDGTVSGQILIIVGVAGIDANDTMTINMGDTTCTGCLSVVMDEVGDTYTLVWTGTTWATLANSEVP